MNTIDKIVVSVTIIVLVLFFGYCWGNSNGFDDAKEKYRTWIWRDCADEIGEHQVKIILNHTALYFINSKTPIQVTDYKTGQKESTENIVCIRDDIKVWRPKIIGL